MRRRLTRCAAPGTIARDLARAIVRVSGSRARRAALYKAAQRNRLRAFRSDGRLLTTAAWIDAYEASLVGNID